MLRGRVVPGFLLKITSLLVHPLGTRGTRMTRKSFTDILSGDGITWGDKEASLGDTQKKLPSLSFGSLRCSM